MRRVLLDGYNLLFREREAPGGASLRDLREEFVRRVDAIRVPGQEVSIVFDGRPGPTGRGERSTGLRVIFSKSPRSADDLIVSLVKKEPRGQVTVITRDRELIARVKSAGGRVASPADFFAPPARRRSAPRPGGSGRRGGKPAPPSGAELDEWERLFEREHDDDGASAGDAGDAGDDNRPPGSS